MKKIIIQIVLVFSLSALPLFAAKTVTATSPASITLDPLGGTEAYGTFDVVWDVAWDLIIEYTDTLDGPNAKTITYTLLWNTVNNSGTASSIVSGSPQTLLTGVPATLGTTYYLWVQYGAFDQFDKDKGSYTLATPLTITAQDN